MTMKGRLVHPDLGDVSIQLVGAAGDQPWLGEESEDEALAVAYQRRWRSFVTEDLELWARRDVLLYTLLRQWAQSSELSPKWVAVTYLRRWAVLEPLVVKMGGSPAKWKLLWPTWVEPSSSGLALPHAQDVALNARLVLAQAALVTRTIWWEYGKWYQLQAVSPSWPAGHRFLNSPPAAQAAESSADLPRAALRFEWSSNEHLTDAIQYALDSFGRGSATIAPGEQAEVSELPVEPELDAAPPAEPPQAPAELPAPELLPAPKLPAELPAELGATGGYES